MKRLLHTATLGVVGLVIAIGSTTAALWWTAKQEGLAWPPDWVRETIPGFAQARGGDGEPGPKGAPSPASSAPPGRVASPRPGPAAPTAVSLPSGPGWWGSDPPAAEDAAAPPEIERHQWAYVVGIDGYADQGAGDLSFAVNDARAVCEVLIRDFGYAPERVRYLASPRADRIASPSPAGVTKVHPATLATLREDLMDGGGWLARQDIQPQDSFLFFFAGHGDRERTTDDGFLVASDSDPYDRTTCLSLQDLSDRLDNPKHLPCHHKALILDACYAGNLFREPESLDQDDITKAGKLLPMTGNDDLDYYLSQPAFLALTAGRETPVADGGGENEHSIFTYHLLDVLRKRADSARYDHRFTFREMAMMVERQVRQSFQGTKRGEGVGQIPRFGYLGKGGDGDLVFAETEHREIDREKRLAEQGRKWLEIAESYVDNIHDGDPKNDVPTYPHVQIFASKALGFQGYGRPAERDPGYRRYDFENPVCFDPRFHQDQIDRANQLVAQSGLSLSPRLVWSSPIKRHHLDEVNGVAWSPDGSRVASASSDRTVRIWDAESGESIATLEGHDEAVNSVAWSPDGTRLASASTDRTIWIWEAEGGTARTKLEGHDGEINSVAWSPNGNQLASASSDWTMRIWEASGGPALETLDGHVGGAKSVAWKPDGSRLASVSGDGTIRIWDARPRGRPPLVHFVGSGWSDNVAWSPGGTRLACATGSDTIGLWNAEDGQFVSSLRARRDQAITLMVTISPVTFVAWSPDGTRLASSWEDVNTVRIWDAVSGEPLPSLGNTGGDITSLAWSPDGTRLVSAGEDGTVRILEADGGETKTTTSHEHAEAVKSVAWSPDGTRLASASDDNTLRIWAADNGEVLHTLTGHSDDVGAAAWNPDGTRIASASDDGTVRLWDAATGEQLGPPLAGHKTGVESVAWSPKGTRLASASWTDITIWEAASGEALHTLESHYGWVRTVAWSPDGTRIASGSTDGAVQIWGADGGEALHTLVGHSEAINAVAWSPNGSRIASAAAFPDNTLRIWDADSGKALRSLESHQGEVSAVAWSPDGTCLASTSRADITIWEAASGEALHTLKSHSEKVTSVAWSPDGTRLASASWDKSIRIWESSGLRSRATLSGHEESIDNLAWSPDGTRIASASDDGTIRIWDGTGYGDEPFLTVKDPGVKSVAWSPDGARLATASSEESIRIWEAGSGRLLDTMEGHSKQLNAVAWSPDGTRLASASSDWTVRIWDSARGVTLATLEGHKEPVRCVAWSPDGTRLASGSWDGSVRLWEPKSGDVLVLEGHDETVSSVAWSPDGTRLACGVGHESVRIWDIQSGQTFVEMGDEKGFFGELLFDTASVAWIPDGTALASTNWDGTVRLWAAENGELLAVLKGHDGPSGSVAWSPDGTRLASASGPISSNLIRIWGADSRMTQADRPNLAHYFRDGWVRTDYENRGLNWQERVSSHLFRGQRFEFRNDLLSPESIVFLLRERKKRQKELCRFHLDRRLWKPAWIWWKRIANPRERAELAPRIFIDFYHLAKRPGTDAPAGWYDTRLLEIWIRHRDLCLAELNETKYAWWFVEEFVQGIASRDAPCGLEELALASLELLHSKAPDWIEPKPEWDQWEEILRSRLEPETSQPDEG